VCVCARALIERGRETDNKREREGEKERGREVDRQRQTDRQTDTEEETKRLALYSWTGMMTAMTVSAAAAAAAAATEDNGLQTDLPEVEFIVVMGSFREKRHSGFPLRESCRRFTAIVLAQCFYFMPAQSIAANFSFSRAQT